MSHSLHIERRFLDLLFVLALFFGLTNSQNTTEALYYEYEVGFMVSTNWASGSDDDFYFQLCNEDRVSVVVNGTNTSLCTEWYSITGGMDNEGYWYVFDYNTDNIGTVTEIRLLTYDNNALCIGKASVDGEKVKNGAFFDDCIEVASGSTDGTCDVLYIKMDNAEFEATLYDPCIYNTTNSYPGPPITTANGTRTYAVTTTVSSDDYSGTATDLFLRLCVDSDRTDCTEWYTIVGGITTAGTTYEFDWNTGDLGNVSYIDFSSLAADRLCLAAVYVDGTGFAFDDDECIRDDTEKGCQTLMIDLVSEETSTETETTCPYDISLNATYEAVDVYKITWDVSDITFSGSDQGLFYIVCDIDGQCSSVYECKDGMDDEGKKYTFRMYTEDYKHFNELNDIWSIDLWTYANEGFCLSEVSVNTNLSANAGLVPQCIDQDDDDGKACNGMNIVFTTEVFTDYEDTDCRWNDHVNNGTIVVSRADNVEWLDWMEDNWIYVGAGIIGLVICCILMCCVIQAKKKKAAEDDENKPWHGGNSAFY